MRQIIFNYRRQNIFLSSLKISATNENIRWLYDPQPKDISIKLCIKGDKFMEERLGNNVTSNTTQRSIEMLQPIWSYFGQWAVQTMFWSSIIAITQCFLQMSISVWCQYSPCCSNQNVLCFLIN